MYEKVYNMPSGTKFIQENDSGNHLYVRVIEPIYQFNGYVALSSGLLFKFQMNDSCGVTRNLMGSRVSF